MIIESLYLPHYLYRDSIMKSSRELLPPKTCEHCGEQFFPRRDKWKTARFCGKSCQFTWMGLKSSKNLHEKWSAETPNETIHSIINSFERFFEKKDECWIWQGAKKSIKKLQYGSFSFRDKRSKFAHRVSYEVYKGEIPEGMLVLHTCDNAPCVNPDHLYLGTYLDNQHDKRARGRCNGEKLTEEQVVEIKKRLIEGESMNKIARHYNVSRQNIKNINDGKIWRWVGVGA